MRIGFDISQTGPNKAGCGFYADGLIRALRERDQENEYILYRTFGDHFYDPHIQTGTTLKFANAIWGPEQDHAEARRFWSRPDETFEFDIGKPDVVHANNFFSPTGLSHARLVFTLYDLSFLENCSWTTEANRTACFEGLFRASVSADWLVAISQFTKDRFLTFFPHYPADRITVVYPASRFDDDHPEEKPSSVKLERRKFWLCVGTLEPRKNYPAILAAYAALCDRVGATHPLVIIGGTGWMMEGINEEIQKRHLSGSVIQLGYVNDAILCWLYRNTSCLVFPSLYEGFGMPVLEAMRCGSPAIATSGSAFPEIVSNSEISQLLVDPLESMAIADAMEIVHRMTPSHIDSLGKVAKKQAQQFSWSRSARSLLQLYQSVLNAPKLFGSQ